MTVSWVNLVLLKHILAIKEARSTIQLCHSAILTLQDINTTDPSPTSGRRLGRMVDLVDSPERIQHSHQHQHQRHQNAKAPKKHQRTKITPKTPTKTLKTLNAAAKKKKNNRHARFSLIKSTAPLLHNFIASPSGETILPRSRLVGAKRNVDLVLRVLHACTICQLHDIDSKCHMTPFQTAAMGCLEKLPSFGEILIGAISIGTKLRLTQVTQSVFTFL